MSYVDMQKNEFKKRQVEEAIVRLKILEVTFGLHGNVRSDFENDGTLNLSEQGILFFLEEKEKELVSDWENRSDSVVYAVIKTWTSIGLMYSMLYVSSYEEDWEIGRNELKRGFPLVYVENVSDRDCSECGCIGIKGVFGGLLRTC